MTNPDDETLWRNRFITVNLVRIAGTVAALAGVYLSMKEEGLLIPGLALALVGLVVSFGAPKWLARHWREGK